MAETYDKDAMPSFKELCPIDAETLTSMQGELHIRALVAQWFTIIETLMVNRAFPPPERQLAADVGNLIIQFGDMRISIVMGLPKNGWFITENPI